DALLDRVDDDLVALTDLHVRRGPAAARADHAPIVELAPRRVAVAGAPAGDGEAPGRGRDEGLLPDGHDLVLEPRVDGVGPGVGGDDHHLGDEIATVDGHDGASLIGGDPVDRRPDRRPGAAPARAPD